MPDLFDPLTLRGVTLRNRIGISPMCMYSAKDGMANDWHFVHLGSRAVGGAAIVFVEATAVQEHGRITPGDMGLWNDQQLEPLARIAAFLKQYGAAAAIQLAHAGRKASTAAPFDRQHPRGPLADADGGWDIVGPSAVPFDQGYRTPHELSVAEIRQVQDAFVAATRRAQKAGFDLVELHAAHGYLAHSFFSPISNRRTDDFGGSLSNRMRFTLETARRMREAWPQGKPMSVRLSVTDWRDDGVTVEDSIALARELKKLGVDIIDCSSGGQPHAKIPVGPGYQVPLAAAIRRGAEVPTMAVGLITEPHQAQAIIAEQKADLVLLARESLRDAYWPFHAARTLGKVLHLPDPYDYAVK